VTTPTVIYCVCVREYTVAWHIDQLLLIPRSWSWTTVSTEIVFGLGEKIRARNLVLKPNKPQPNFRFLKFFVLFYADNI